MPESETKPSSALVSTGVAGLDEILHGGLPAKHIYLVEGDPGAGKTTLGLEFLLEGARRGEQVLYLAFSETREEVHEVAASHGWDASKLIIAELGGSAGEDERTAQYTMFHPSEVELGATTRRILEHVRETKPDRIVLDSMTDLRLLARDPLHYRRQVISIKDFLWSLPCTVLLLDDPLRERGDTQLQSVVHGVISLEQLSPDFGAERRRLRIVKLRGRKYSGGYHDFIIVRGGLEIFPRVVAREYPKDSNQGLISSGLAEMDALTGGGLPAGSSTLLIGPAGCGKSTLATKYALAAVERGQGAAFFIFDESIDMLLRRSKGLGLDLTEHLQTGAITIEQVDPGEMSPGQFAHRVRQEVERRHCAVVVIDSLNGYLNAAPAERFLSIQLHELLVYLGQRGVLSFLVVGQAGMMAPAADAPIETSYLADNVIIFRYFEVLGEVRQALSVMKKRGGSHERTIREFRLGSGGLYVGPPLRQFQGVLTSVPEIVGELPKGFGE
jgi:circadian clock protein KaiC